MAGVIVVVAVASSITAMLFVRRRAPEGSFFTDGDRASGVFGVLAGGFAIFAGFVIFLAFTTYDQSRAGAEAEALLVVQQYETAQFLAPATRDRLAGELTCYGRSVVEREWPLMEKGELGDTINPWGFALFRTIRAAETPTYAEETAFAKWLDQTSDREEARRDRVYGAAGVIPADALDRPASGGGDHLLLHAVLRRPGRDEALPGDARRLCDRGRHGDAARDLRAGQPVSARPRERQAGRHGAHASGSSTRCAPRSARRQQPPCDENGVAR